MQILKALRLIEGSTRANDSSENLVEGNNAERTREELLENLVDKKEEEMLKKSEMKGQNFF